MIRISEVRMGAKKIHKGMYEYNGYRLYNCGYHHPDHCIWWEAVNMETGCADYHANTKRCSKWMYKKFGNEYAKDYLFR